MVGQGTFGDVREGALSGVFSGTVLADDHFATRVRQERRDGVAAKWRAVVGVQARTDDEQLRAVAQAGQLCAGVAASDPQSGGDVLRARKELRDLVAQPKPCRHAVPDAAVAGDDPDDVKASM